MGERRDDLAGAHVAVTGAGTGIGRAVALRLAERGASLTLMGRRREPLEETAELARAAGAADCGVQSVDVRDPGAVDAAFAAAADARGPLYALVANAGLGGPNRAGAGDRFDDLVATNLGGTYACCRAAERHLAPGPDARHLVLMSSILARIGVAGYTGYCASKAALLGLARSLAVELGTENVQVNAVCPGWVDTSMAREGLEGIAQAADCSFDEAKEMAMSQVPLGRMSEPEDVAGLVSWLISPDARGVTGQGIDMNGGAWM